MGPVMSGLTHRQNSALIDSIKAEVPYVLDVYLDIKLRYRISGCILPYQLASITSLTFHFIHTN